MVSQVLGCTLLGGGGSFLPNLCPVPAVAALGFGLWHAVQVLRLLGESGQPWERQLGPHQETCGKQGGSSSQQQVGSDWGVCVGGSGQ